MKFTNISIKEMREVFKETKGWREESQTGTKETIFEWNIPSRPELVIKVYSSIKDGNCRKRGSDAIRVCCVNTKQNTGWIKSRHVKRVENWRNNLQDRVLEVMNQAKARKA